jgi:hypothetical protein
MREEGRSCKKVMREEVYRKIWNQRLRSSDAQTRVNTNATQYFYFQVITVPKMKNALLRKMPQDH